MGQLINQPGPIYRIVGGLQGLLKMHHGCRVTGDPFRAAQLT